MNNNLPELTRKTLMLSLNLYLSIFWKASIKNNFLLIKNIKEIVIYKFCFQINKI